MVLLKTCPSCNKAHRTHTTKCAQCYRRDWVAKREPRQCHECKKMKRVFTTEFLCSACYQRVRNKRMVGTCVDCGQFRRIPSNGRCVYCDQRIRLERQPLELCVQCERQAKIYNKGLGICRSCQTNNVKRKAKHGVSIEWYVGTLREQNKTCAICEQPFGRAPHIDHDHTSGQIRSLLCYKCNVGLGSFMDSPKLLRMAALYLEFHKNKKVA